MKCDIEIKGNTAYFSGKYPLDDIRKVTSYMVPGAWFSPKYKKGIWDGRKHLFNKRYRTLPAGLISIAVAELKKHKVQVNIVDRREENVPSAGSNGFDLHTIDFGGGKFGYQLEAAEACVKKKRGILKIATNGGKSSIAAAVTKHLSVPTLFVVPGLELLRQAKESFSKYLDIPLESIGSIGDSTFEIGEWITVANMDSLYSRKDSLKEQFAKWDLLWLDECHVGGSDTAYKVLSEIGAYYRFGLSGTPLDRTDGATLRLIAQTGPVIYEVKNKELIDLGVSVQPVAELMSVHTPKLPKKMPWHDLYEKGVVNNDELNQKISERIHKSCSVGEHAIIMVERKAHGELLVNKVEELSEGRYGSVFMHGSMTSDQRQSILQKFRDGDIKCLVVTSILKQGVDLDCIDLIAYAGGGKSKINILQRLGRGLRTGRGRDKVTILVPVNFSNPILLKHSKKTIDTFKKEDCFEFKVIE